MDKERSKAEVYWHGQREVKSWSILTWTKRGQNVRPAVVLLTLTVTHPSSLFSQRSKAEVDKDKLREIELRDEQLAAIIQEQERMKERKYKLKRQQLKEQQRLQVNDWFLPDMPRIQRKREKERVSLLYICVISEERERGLVSYRHVLYPKQGSKREGWL